MLRFFFLSLSFFSFACHYLIFFYAGVTTMLNFFTTSNGFRSTLPVVSNLTAMNVWDGVCMCFIYASLLEFVIVNYYGRKSPKHNVVYRPGENPVAQVKYLFFICPLFSASISLRSRQTKKNLYFFLVLFSPFCLNSHYYNRGTNFAYVIISMLCNICFQICSNLIFFSFFF